MLAISPNKATQKCLLAHQTKQHRNASYLTKQSNTEMLAISPNEGTQKCLLSHHTKQHRHSWYLTKRSNTEMLAISPNEATQKSLWSYLHNTAAIRRICRWRTHRCTVHIVLPGSPSCLRRAITQKLCLLYARSFQKTCFVHIYKAKF